MALPTSVTTASATGRDAQLGSVSLQTSTSPSSRTTSLSSLSHNSPGLRDAGADPEPLDQLRQQPSACSPGRGSAFGSPLQIWGSVAGPRIGSCSRPSARRPGARRRPAGPVTARRTREHEHVLGSSSRPSAVSARRRHSGGSADVDRAQDRRSSGLPPRRRPSGERDQPWRRPDRAGWDPLPGLRASISAHLLRLGASPSS